MLPDSDSFESWTFWSSHKIRPIFFLTSWLKSLNLLSREVRPSCYKMSVRLLGWYPTLSRCIKINSLSKIFPKLNIMFLSRVWYWNWDSTWCEIEWTRVYCNFRDAGPQCNEVLDLVWAPFAESWVVYIYFLIFAFVNWNFLCAILKVPSRIEKILKNCFACALYLLLCLFLRKKITGLSGLTL